jgi:hypothetical protein
MTSESYENGSCEDGNSFQLDSLGRLLKPFYGTITDDDVPEELNLFVSNWKTIKHSSKVDWTWTTKYPWSEVNGIVNLKRLDVYSTDSPSSQQATTNIIESRELRKNPEWSTVRSLFFLDVNTEHTVELLIESTGPPVRHRVLFIKKIRNA